MEYGELAEAALKIRAAAYAPYSRFNVGAAALAASGRVYTGANVENASYGAAICAERAAVAAAVCAGERRLKAVAVCGAAADSDAGFCPPCGVCRQVLREFCDPAEMDVVLVRGPGDFKVITLERLLPFSFGPDALKAGGGVR
ncbi:MAG: cytidine deaminase [Kiritimatiellae bacterium]|nr:cytidine deaminase [Kiritimatiellia bacterium]